MVREIIGIGVIVLVYVCMFVVIFAPTIYVFWLYLISRRVRFKKTSTILRTAVTTLCVNALVAYFLAHLAFDYFLGAKVAELDALARTTVCNAIVSQEGFFRSHGRYYQIGPVRGPYVDDHGLTVERDVVLEVAPHFDEAAKRETFRAYAAHVLGKSLMVNTPDGKAEPAPRDSQESARIREKLLNRVR